MNNFNNIQTFLSKYESDKNVPKELKQLYEFTLKSTNYRDSYVKSSFSKIKRNENDYIYHSWVELENENLVVDYNHNIILNKDVYYRLFESVAISKVNADKLKQMIQTIIFDCDIYMHQLELIYFGEEIMRDLKKNEKILQKTTNNI